MKNKLLKAIKSLPMLAGDKEKFANVINGGNSKLGYLYFRNVLIDGSYPIGSFFLNFVDDAYLISSVTFGSDAFGIVPVPLRALNGADASKIYKILVADHIFLTNLIPFYDYIESIKDSISGYDESIIDILKANEITEEEFLENIKFGAPEQYNI